MTRGQMRAIDVARACAAAWPPMACAILVSACARHEAAPRPAPSVAASSAPEPPPPVVLYLPDGAPRPVRADSLPVASVTAVIPQPPPIELARRCPADMVDVRGVFCVDRYEATLVDAVTGKTLSPYYHPTPDVTRREYDRWKTIAMVGAGGAPQVLVPPPPEWQLRATRIVPRALSIADSTPSGYLSGQVADSACKNAGKRLCTVEEWVTACRGEHPRKFPYGHLYQERQCNVFRETHPAALLHGNASEGHLDPRLNTVVDPEGPLLRLTGATPTCQSEWEDGGVYDMVGNLDEWIDDAEGTFVGGFFARSTRDGCDARVGAHTFDYYDYSLGTRCCSG